MSTTIPLSVREEAEEWLESYLRDGAKTYPDVTRAGEAAGHSRTTLWRVSQEMGVEKVRRGSRPSLWYLPPEPEVDDDLDLDASAFERVMEIEPLETWEQVRGLVDLMLSLDEEARRDALLVVVKKAG